MFVHTSRLQPILFGAFWVVTSTMGGLFIWAMASNGGARAPPPTKSISSAERSFLILQAMSAVAGSWTGACIRLVLLSLLFPYEGERLTAQRQTVGLDTLRKNQTRPCAQSAHWRTHNRDRDRHPWRLRHLRDSRHVRKASLEPNPSPTNAARRALQRCHTGWMLLRRCRLLHISNTSQPRTKYHLVWHGSCILLPEVHRRCTRQCRNVHHRLCDQSLALRSCTGYFHYGSQLLRHVCFPSGRHKCCRLLARAQPEVESTSPICWQQHLYIQVHLRSQPSCHGCLDTKCVTQFPWFH